MQYVLEVPVFTRISPRFKEFLAKLGTPTVSQQCDVKFWHNKLTFSANGIEKRVSISPFVSSFSETERVALEKLISAFASKFNCCMALSSKGDVSVKIEIISPTNETFFEKKVSSRIRVTIDCHTIAAEMALHNFFLVVDE